MTDTHDAEIEDILRKYPAMGASISKVQEEWLRVSIKSYGDSREARGRESMREDILSEIPMEDDGAPDRSNWSAGWGDYRNEAINKIRSLPPKQ